VLGAAGFKHEFDDGFAQNQVFRNAVMVHLKDIGFLVCKDFS
jgi:hypothetical protein